MPQVFLSYSSKSKNLVTMLAQDFETAGHEVWFDHKLTGGQAWWDQILENIRQCDLFVFALTPDALDSYACQLEYGYAHQLGKNVLPVLVADDVTVSLLPPELTLIQFVDYRTQDRQAALRLMNALNRLPPLKPLPDPLPEGPAVPISYLGSLKEQISSRKTLSFDEQASIVLKLKEHLREGEHTEDALRLFQEIKKRNDLYAKIDKEIDTIIGADTPPPPPRRVFGRGAHPTPVVQPGVSSPPLEAQRPRALSVKRINIQSIPGALKWPLYIVLSGLIWALSGVIVPAGGSYFYVNYYVRLPIPAIIVAWLVHGLVSALYLRQIEAPPRQPITPGWLLRSALMGGPATGLLLRRVVPMAIWQMVVVAIGWVIGLFVAMSIAPETYDSYFGDYIRSSLHIGLYFGAFGALVTWGVYALLKRSQRRSETG